MPRHSQVLIDEGCRSRPVVAGKLDAHLDKVDAGFVYRTKDIYINLLDPAATRAAVTRPFIDRRRVGHGRRIGADGKLGFTQVVGDKVWDAKEDAGCAEVDVALVQGVEQKVWKQRLSIYVSIHSRMKVPYC